MTEYNTDPNNNHTPHAAKPDIDTNASTIMLMTGQSVRLHQPTKKQKYTSLSFALQNFTWHTVVFVVYTVLTV
jgi:hypothetical protein